MAILEMIRSGYIRESREERISSRIKFRRRKREKAIFENLGDDKVYFKVKFKV